MKPSDNSFDLVVLGTGPAASTVATKAAEAGLSVAVVESRKPGGTCALRGCNPKKVLTEAATMAAQACHARDRLDGNPELTLDWKALHAFQESFTESIPDSTEEKYSELGISLLHGSGSFVSPSHIKVGDQIIEGRKIFIGTGAQPRRLDIDGCDRVTQSDQFLELQQLPDSITFIGGGYVSMEFAHVAVRSGAQVTVIHQGSHVLDGFDSDLVSQLTAYSQQIGISILCDAKVIKVVDAGLGHLKVQYTHSGKEQDIESQIVVHGAGRVPAVQDLKLDQAEVQFDEQGITVDAFLRSRSNPRVFAAGDCAATDAPKLTPCATEEARVVTKNILEDEPTHRPQYGAVPKTAFTVPPIASVGLSEEEAAKAGHSYEVRQNDTSNWGATRKIGPPCSGYKIIVSKPDDLILGAHLLGPAASETINLFTLAMNQGITAKQLKSTLMVFPTHAAGIRKML